MTVNSIVLHILITPFLVLSAYLCNLALEYEANGYGLHPLIALPLAIAIPMLMTGVLVHEIYRTKLPKNL